MPNEIKITVKKIDTDPLDKVGDAGKKAGRDVEQGLEKGFKGGAQASSKAAAQIGADLDKVGDKAGGVGEAIGSKLEGGLDLAKGAMLAGGAAIGGLIMQGVSQQFEERKIGGLLAAQTGAVSGAAGELGRTAGEVFGDNFGESLDDVRVAMKAVFDNKLIDRNAAQSDIKAVTESLMTVAQVVEEDAGRVARAAQQLVRTGLAGSVTEALDMITQAQQQGLNASEDLLDTTTEYSTKFRDLGLTGAQAFGLISQAVQAGARDTDTAADALKEFAIRGQDMSATTARGFREIGLDAEVMGNRIAAGGNSARDALGQTLDGLRAIQDPIVRDQAAVDLFGTKAEDLGDSLFAMDLDGAGAQFGDFADAAKDASDQIAASTPPIEAAWRNLGKGINNALDLAGQSDAIDEVQARAREFASSAKDAQEEHRKAVDAAANAWREQGGSIRKVTESLDEYISKQREYASGVLDLSAAQIGFQKALDDATASAQENGKTLDLNTEKGRENQEALNDLVSETFGVMDAMQQQGSTAQELAAFMGGARDSFIATAVSMGIAAPKAAELADRLRLIPGDYTARVHTPGVQESTNAVRTLRGNLVDLTNRDWIASVSVSVPGIGGGGKIFKATGGAVGTAATGGPRANQVLVGEQGPEIVDLAPGSTVHSAPDSGRMMASWSGGGGGPVYVVPEVLGGADSAAGVFVQKLMRDGYLKFRTVDGVEVRVG